MKCNKVRTKLAGYLDDAIAGPAAVEQRAEIRVHLNECGECRKQQSDSFRQTFPR